MISLLLVYIDVCIIDCLHMFNLDQKCFKWTGGEILKSRSLGSIDTKELGLKCLLLLFEIGSLVAKFRKFWNW